VRDALDLLGASRLDHGVRAVDEPELLKRLVDERITLNVCLSSNLVHLYGSLEEHPIAALIGAGVPVTINTDDPGYLGIDLAGEFEKAAEHLGWALEDAAAITRTAIDASFCTPEEAAALHRRLDEFLEQP
jgi:adenosine deaminase